MSHAAPPALTVRYDGPQRTFAAGHDLVVGRDLRADMRITHPLISRAHLLLRFDQGRWLAIDNGSLNGTYVHGRRVAVIDIHARRAATGLRDRPPRRRRGSAAADDVDADRQIAGARPTGTRPTAATPRRRAEATGADRPGTVAPVSRCSASPGLPRPAPAGLPTGPATPGTGARPATRGAGGFGSPNKRCAEDRNGTAGDQHATRSRQPGHQDDPGDPARLAHAGQAAGFGDDRSRQRQRHRDPGCAGFASSRVLGRLAAWHRDPGCP